MENKLWRLCCDGALSLFCLLFSFNKCSKKKYRSKRNPHQGQAQCAECIVNFIDSIRTVSYSIQKVNAMDEEYKLQHSIIFYQCSYVGFYLEHAPFNEVLALYQSPDKQRRQLHWKPNPSDSEVCLASWFILASM